VAIYPELVVVTGDDTLPAALVETDGRQPRRGDRTDIGGDDVVARVLYDGKSTTDESYLPDRYRFSVEVRTWEGIETFADWLVRVAGDRTAMLQLDGEGVDPTASAIREALREQWRTSGTRSIGAGAETGDEAAPDDPDVLPDGPNGR
jgi:hypothetical protein